MELVPLLVIIAIVMLWLKEHKERCNQEQLKEIEQLQGQTELEKVKAKFSLIEAISSICALIKSFVK